MARSLQVFALADLHLATTQHKPMTVFGPNWAEHPGAIYERWPQVVGEGDLVLLPGDLSWAMRLPDALTDLGTLTGLPGVKVISRGNHDYWWPAIGKLRAALPDGMYAVQNDALRFGEVTVCGTRGWLTPGSESFGEGDEHIYRREAERLRLALESARGLGGERTVLMLHYPPTGPGFAPTLFTELIEQYRPDAVVYGHLHGVPPERSLRQWQGVPCFLVAADGLGFTPRLILDGSGVVAGSRPPSAVRDAQRR